MAQTFAWNFLGTGQAPVTDLSGNGRGFTPTGNNTRTSVGGGYTYGGARPNAVGFHQTSSDTQIGPAITGLNISPRTLCGWAIITGSANGWVISMDRIDGANPSGTGVYGIYNNSGAPQFRCKDNSGSAFTRSFTGNAAYRFYALTYDGTNLKVYQSDGAGVVAQVGANIAMGSVWDATRFLLLQQMGTGATLSDWQGFDTALSLSQLQSAADTPLDSGTAYTLSPADTEGLTDSASLDVAKPFSDSENLTDSSVLSLGRGVTQADPENLTDTAAFAVEKALSDPEGLTDSASLTFNRSVLGADTEGLTDSATTELGRLLTASDTEGLTDSIATQVGAVYGDLIGLTDSAQVQLSGSGTLDLSDTEGLTDSAALAVGKTLTDSLGLTDSFQIELFRQLSVTASDTESLTDTAVLARAGTLAPSDAEALTDQIAFAASWSKLDDVGLTDSAQTQMVLSRAYVDSMGMTDSFVIQLGPQIPDRDLTLAGYLQPGRLRGTIAPGRLAGSLQPGRWKGEVEW